MATYMDLDPVMTGFEQPSTMTPTGQLAAYRGQVPVSSSTVSTRYSQPQGVGIGAGAGYIGFPEQTEQAGVMGAIGAVPAALSAVGISAPAWLLAALGVAGAGYGIYQALGGGEGGGLFGNNLLGGDVSTIPGSPIEIGGPGLAEPGPGTGWNLIREWHVNYDWGTLQYYLVQKMGSRSRLSNRWIAMYNTRTKMWKAWRWVPPKLAVIGKNLPRHQMLTRLRANLSRHKADARTILKYADPTGYAKTLGYRKYRRRK